jgi:competence protein ComEC
LQADVLLAAHHGSGSSTSRLFLRSVDPELLLVSAAAANRFGHPAQRVRNLAAESGIPLLNTAQDGAIEVIITPDGRMHCRRYRHARAPFWRHRPASSTLVSFPSS